MTRAHRWTWAIALLLLGEATVIQAADVAAFLPKETDLVISLNVRQVLDSPLVKNNALDLIKTSLAGNKDAQEAIKALGLDPLKDFDRVSIGIGLEELNNPKGLIVIEGQFDVKKIGDVMDALAKSDAKHYGVEQISGKTVYKIATSNQPVPMYAAPIDSKVIVLATVKEQLVGAFEAAKGTRKPVIKKDLADLLAKADAKSSLYLVASTKGKLDAIPLPDAQMKKIIEQIQSITADLKVDQDVNLELAIGTPGVDEAKKMRELVAGGLDLAKIQIKVVLAQQPELQPLIELVGSMKASQKEKAVVVTGKLSGNAVEKMLQKGK